MSKIRVYRLSDLEGENAVIVSTIGAVVEHVRDELMNASLDMEDQIGLRLDSYSMDRAEFNAMAVNGRIG